MAGNANCPVVIAIRERPVADCAVTYYDHTNAITANGTTVTFDHILKSTTTQEETYNTLIKPLVQRVIEGFNCSVFAYGQSGAGKSYTMGFKTEHLEGDNIGIIPRCLKALLHHEGDIENIDTNNGVRREIRVSFLEVYMKNKVDLLSKDPVKDQSAMLRGGFTRKLLQSVQEGCDILREAVKKRHVRSTLMNPESSRSHFIFTIHVNTLRATNGTMTVTESKLNLVDLGGSEGVRRTQHDGIAKVEGVEIGQGLLSLQKVINEMITEDRVVSHRGNALTEVLRDSLNRNCFLTLICCIRPGKEDIKETATTLRFANSVKQIKNDPKITTILAKERLKITPRKKFTGLPTPLKRLNSIKKPTKQLTIPHRNTFCTPQKPRNLAAHRFNQTDSKALEIPSVAKVKPYCPPYMPSASQRPSLAESTFSSNFRLSTSEANISTSTAFNESLTNLPTNLSRQVDDLWSTFKANLQLIIGSHAGASSNTASQATAVRAQLEETMTQLRNEIQPFVNIRSVDVEPESQNVDTVEETHSEEPQETEINNQSFRTSSPIIFKVPAPPPQMLNSIQCSVIKIPTYVEEEPLQRKQLFPSELTLADDNSNATIDNEELTQISLPPAAPPAPTRRSTRLSLKKSTLSTTALNNTTQNDETIISNTTAIRRRSSRLSLKSQNKEKTSTTLPVIKEVVKKVKKQVIMHPALTLEYKLSKNVETKAGKKEFISKHRSAILDLFNSGSVNQLKQLSQIGLKTAYTIVTHRTLKGKFKSLKDVEKLPIWRGTAWKRFTEVNLLTDS